MSGKESGHIPFQIDTFFGRAILFRIVRFIGHHVLTLGTPIGRKQHPKLLNRTTPLVRVKPKNLIDAGVQRVERVVGVQDGLPLLANERTLDVSNIIWCTGYEPGFSWIDLPVFDEKGKPMHERGVVHREPGMYFVGLHFLYAMSSATLVGVGRDAEYVANAIERRIQKRARDGARVRPALSSRTAAAGELMAS
jgi:putative flavoprotein involved in K+ transport